jgi:phosphopentomutase
VIPVNRLYEMCEIARNMLTGELAVGRVIARPFSGKGNGNYFRTRNRHDYSLKPFHDTVLDKLQKKGIEVDGVGKIYDIFSGNGITHSVKMKNNNHGMELTMSLMNEIDKGLIYVNLVDFDMVYGHRNDVEGYSNALMDFDKKLGELLKTMKSEDVLIINADHGCDPTTESTDHSREYIPILVYGNCVKAINIGVRKSFSDIGQTVAELLKADSIDNGESFAQEVLK